MRPADPLPGQGDRGAYPEGAASEERAFVDDISGNSPSVDSAAMRRAISLAASVRTNTSPNPWVGCVVAADDEWFEGATEAPGGAHAEAVALKAAGGKARGATVYTTLEPCAHQGRTPPCAIALRDAGVARVVVGMLDPDPQVQGRGVEQLRAGGIEVEIGLGAVEVEALLAPYLKHRRTGLPWVVLKLACTFDGRIAAPDGSSRWLTGPEARADAHRLRAESDAVMVGAGTVRADDPELTARIDSGRERQPLRVVLGRIPPDAKVEPALEMAGDPAAVLGELGAKGILQVLVEGGAKVAHQFHAAGVVDRYVLYMAPALFGGDDAVPMFAGAGAPTVNRLWRGRLLSVTPLGQDLRVDLGCDPGSSPDAQEL